MSAPNIYMFDTNEFGNSCHGTRVLTIWLESPHAMYDKARVELELKAYDKDGVPLFPRSDSDILVVEAYFLDTRLSVRGKGPMSALIARLYDMLGRLTLATDWKPYSPKT